MLILLHPGNGLSHGSRIRTLGTRGNEWNENLGSEALKAEAAELEVVEEGKETSTMRSCAGSRASAASLTRQSVASPHPMVESDVVSPQQVDQVDLPRLFPDQPGPLDNSPDRATTDRHSQIGSLLYLIAPVMARLCPEMGGGAQGTSQGFKPSPLQAIRVHLLTTTTQGEGVKGIGRKSGEVEGGHRILGCPTTSLPIRSISSRVVWTVACQRKQALGAAAAYLM